MNIGETLKNLWENTGFYQSTWQNYVIILVACVLLYLAIVKKFEPLLLVPIAFGMLLVNIPGGRAILMQEEILDQEILESGEIIQTVTQTGGFLYYIKKGVDLVIFPPIIFLGIGAMTDFGPLIANPKSLILGAAAQLGIFLTFFLGVWIFGGDGLRAAAVAIIGGADGPTSIYVATKLLGPDSGMVGTITIAAYSYMALIPIIQPPIMKALTTKKERSIKMGQMRKVSKAEKIIFPIMITIICGLILPSALPLLGMLMLGNLLKESLVTERLANTASNALTNIVTIFLGVVVGAKVDGPTFLTFDTLKIVALGLLAFCFGTAGGILMAKFMNLFLKKKINPLIGSAGVSAVPMAARVSQLEGQKADPTNHLLMHAMGPNVAGVIGSAVAAGILIAIFG